MTGRAIGPDVVLPAAVRETLQIFWQSPFPATLQDGEFRLVDVNDAFLEFSGFAREALIGRDPIDRQPTVPRRTPRGVRGAFKSARATPKMRHAVAAAGVLARVARSHGVSTASPCLLP